MIVTLKSQFRQFQFSSTLEIILLDFPHFKLLEQLNNNNKKRKKTEEKKQEKNLIQEKKERKCSYMYDSSIKK